jgi:hypothetical protein
VVSHISRKTSEIWDNHSLLQVCDESSSDVGMSDCALLPFRVFNAKRV